MAPTQGRLTWRTTLAADLGLTDGAPQKQPVEPHPTPTPPHLTHKQVVPTPHIRIKPRFRRENPKTTTVF